MVCIYTSWQILITFFQDILVQSKLPQIFPSQTIKTKAAFIFVNISKSPSKLDANWFTSREQSLDSVLLFRRLSTNSTWVSFLQTFMSFLNSIYFISASHKMLKVFLKKVAFLWGNYNCIQAIYKYNVILAVNVKMLFMSWSSSLSGLDKIVNPNVCDVVFLLWSF